MRLLIPFYGLPKEIYKARGTDTWKDYRANGHDRAKVMTLAIDEFIRRFLIHVLPDGFHRIRYYSKIYPVITIT